MASAEDQADVSSVFKEENEFKQLIELVRVQPDRSSNLHEIFNILLNKKLTNDASATTQADLHKLDRFGTALACVGKFWEARHCFEQILSIDPNFLKSYQNLDNIKHQLMERWHFVMINDAKRNAKYKAALRKVIAKVGDAKVLDIGTGTGLLAIYARECGATNVIACEQSPFMCRLATEAFKRNGCADQIKLIQKHSAELDAEIDLNGKVDVIVTETMDCGVFGEGLLQTLIHAKEHLLKPTGVIIPSRIKLFVAGFQSRQLAEEYNVVNSSSFTETIYVRNFCLSANCDEPYDSCHVAQLKDFKVITKCEEALNVNLNNLDELYALASGTLKKNVRLAYTIPGSILDGFFMWFQMSLDDEDTVTMSTDPFSINPRERASCWECAIFRLNHRFANTQKLQYLNATISCDNGILQMNHYYDLYAKTYNAVPFDVVKFLNDTEFINQIEFDVFAELKRRSKRLGKSTVYSKTRPSTNLDRFHLNYVLDFLPFPTIGIALLKEAQVKKVYCTKNACEFISFIAETNCIPIDSFVFVDDPADTLLVPEKFDLIILPLVDRFGCVISSQIANYDLLKSNKLSANGIMVPDKMEVAVDLIHSEWLRTVTQATDTEIIDRLHIGPLINEYATTLHLDLHEEFPHKCLSRNYRIAVVQLSDLFYEIEHKLYLGERSAANASELQIHGILFYYSFTFTKSSQTSISTKRPNSFVRLGCFICDGREHRDDNGFVTLRYRQNSGVIKIDLK